MKTVSNFFLFLLFLTQLVSAQVPKNVVVEHFTNTVCSVCAARNPGFYTNLDNQTGVLHIAFHPSAPYASCKLNQHNKIENDARTHYYGIYGSTPRFVIQGTVIPSSSTINTQALFDPFLNQTSPLQVYAHLINESSTMVKVEVVVKTMATHTLGQLVLTTSAVEELLNYVGPNGEQQQHDVFRKSFFGIDGQVFDAQDSIGDSLVFTASIAKNSEWTLNQLYAMVLVQEVVTKEVIQSARSSNLQVMNGINELSQTNVSIFPNPASHYINVQMEEPSPTQLTIYNIAGLEVLNTEIVSTTRIQTDMLVNGLYFVKLSNPKGTELLKLLIQNNYSK